MKLIKINIAERNNFPLISDAVAVVVMLDLVNVEMIRRILNSFFFRFWFHKPRSRANFIARGRQMIRIDENLFNDFYIRLFNKNSGKQINLKFI